VNGRHIARLAQIGGGGKFMRCEQGINRCIAIDVKEHWHIQVVHLLERLVDHRLRSNQLPLPILFAARPAREVGGGEGSGSPLRGAVNGDFDPTNFHPLLVLPPAGHRKLGEGILQIGDERVGNHINAVGPGSGGAVNGLQRAQVRGPLLRCGDARLGVHLVRGLGALNLLLRCQRRGFFKYWQKSRFHDQTVGLIRPRLAHDDAAVGGLGVRTNAVELLCQGVEHRAVH